MADLKYDISKGFLRLGPGSGEGVMKKPAQAVPQPAKVETATKVKATKVVKAALEVMKPLKVKKDMKVKKKSDYAVSFVKENPKRAGSAPYVRYEKYKSAKTFQEALSLGASYGDISYDTAKGFMTTGK